MWLCSLADSACPAPDRRTLPLQTAARPFQAAAGICKASATVAMNVRLRDLNVDAARQDERRSEVITSGLAIWGHAQLAVDTAVVSPLTLAGAPRHAGGRTAGATFLARERPSWSPLGPVQARRPCCRPRRSLEPGSCKFREAPGTPTCSRGPGILSRARRRCFCQPMVLLSLVCRCPCLRCLFFVLASHGHCRCGRRPSSFG